METNVEDLNSADETQIPPHQLFDLERLYVFTVVILLLYVHSHRERVFLPQLTSTIHK